MASRISEARDEISSNKPQKAKIVYMRTIFTKIGEIDTVKEYFSAEIILEARWFEPIFNGMQNQLDNSSIDWSQFWNPKLRIENGVGELKETITRSVFWTGQGDGVVLEKRWIKGNLVEILELWNFPFDAQDLSITVISSYPVAEVELTEDLNNLSCINKFVFMDEQEWELDTKVHSMKKVLQLSDGEGDQVVHSSIDFFCKAVRRSGFFIWNTFFVLLFICLMTFTTFAVVYTKPENRLQLTFILLLTTVAFRSNVNNNLPKISYLTLMDKYIIYTMIIQCVVCIWHAIVGGALHCVYPCVLVVSAEAAFWADKIIFIILISFFIISAIAFFFYVHFSVNVKHRRASKNEFIHNTPLLTQTNNSNQTRREI